uniref:Runt domain-containing protein n=1 Tax=Macrostomum lignano TaxID=282301 RepID=A0A1I8F9P9_9PLAT
RASSNPVTGEGCRHYWCAPVREASSRPARRRQRGGRQPADWAATSAASTSTNGKMRITGGAMRSARPAENGHHQTNGVACDAAVMSGQKQPDHRDASATVGKRCWAAESEAAPPASHCQRKFLTEPFGNQKYRNLLFLLHSFEFDLHLLICSSAHLLICSSTHLLICSSAICSSAHLIICSSAHLLICLICYLLHLLICSSAHLLICSFSSASSAPPSALLELLRADRDAPDSSASCRSPPPPGGQRGQGEVGAEPPSTPELIPGQLAAPKQPAACASAACFKLDLISPPPAESSNFDSVNAARPGSVVFNRTGAVKFMKNMQIRPDNRGRPSIRVQLPLLAGHARDEHEGGGLALQRSRVRVRGASVRARPITKRSPMCTLAELPGPWSFVSFQKTADRAEPVGVRTR